MASTRTSGITIDCDGHRFIDKRHRGVRIGRRVRAMSQEQTERRLKEEMKRVNDEAARRSRLRTNFADCALRYLEQFRDMRSLEPMRVHVRLLVKHLGHLEPQQVHDSTLAPFISARIAECASATTINRSLEVLRTILHRAARSYRDDGGRPWLDAVPPPITMLPEHARPPYPITWEEQDRFPTHEFYFLEMNTRIQVEHAVSEMITGLDLVELQIRQAAGEALVEMRGTEVKRHGHAIECRRYTEDPARSFYPSPGPLLELELPIAAAHARVDTGVQAGDVVTPFYDPMISKIVCWGETRGLACETMRAALAQVKVAGVKANLALVKSIPSHPEFLAGRTHTRFIEEHAIQLVMQATAPAAAN